MTRPEIIGHRGASRERPENTLAAFTRAVQLGADAVELDVHRTLDGVLVVHHDAEIAGEGPITGLSATQIADLRFKGEPIPTLSQVFAVVGEKLRIYVELKGAETAPVALAVIRAARETTGRGADAAAVHSFDHRLIAQAQALDAGVPRGVLEVSYPVHGTAAAQAVQARDLWRHRDFVDPALVRAAHAEGRRVVAWTVNDAATMQRFASWGVDAICTDDIALARTALGA